MAKILDAYQNCPYKPEVTISDNAFRIILPSSNKNSSLEGLTQAESKVIDMLATKQSIGRRDVEMALDVSQTRAGQILKNLVDKGRIKPRGAGRSRVYTRA
jgi:ATP-dependent DNA helicase RecG